MTINEFKYKLMSNGTLRMTSVDTGEQVMEMPTQEFLDTYEGYLGVKGYRMIEVGSEEYYAIAVGLELLEKREYIDDDDIVTVTCPEHGPFDVRAGDHLSGEGCPECEKK